MKKLRHLFTALFVLFAVVANAHDITIDGVYYNIISDNELEVTYYGDDCYNVPEAYKYQGDLTISKKVVHGGVIFTVTSIGSYAFYNCYGLTSITIGNSVANIGEYAFYWCSGLTSVTIPNSVTSIGNAAFDGCYGLTSITIPNSVTSIGDWAFQACSGLTSITISNSVTSIGVSVFSGCSGLESIVVDPGNTKYDSRGNCNAIIATESNTLLSGCKNTVIPNSVTAIGYNAFCQCSGLTSITIPNSVTAIGDCAFLDCPGLTSITIPNSVTSIGYNAFCWCRGLESIVVDPGNTKYDSRENCNAIIETESNTLLYGCQNTVIPNSVTSIGDNAFIGCDGLTSITIPNSVTSIGDWAFQCCYGLTSITIPNSVTAIGDGAFYSCSGLTSITIPNSVTSIESSAFYYCSGLTSITIPNSVTSIGNHAFGDCDELTSITIPNSVASIGENAFWSCSELTSVTIGNSVTSIGEEAFNDCQNLKEVINLSNLDIVSGEESHGKVALNADEVITVPGGYREGDYIFTETDGVYALAKYLGTDTNWVLPESCNGNNYVIPANFFNGNSEITSITIPAAVTAIGEDAFADCQALTEVHINDLAAWCNIDFANGSANPTNVAHNLYLNGELITELVIPSNITVIKNQAFRGCSKITSVTMHDGVTTLGQYAFNTCTGMTSAKLSAGLTVVPRGLFSGCTNLREVVVPDSIETIELSSFYGCALTSITIPAAVTTIADNAFNLCENLVEVINFSKLNIVAGEGFHGGVALYAERVLSPRLYDGVEFVYDNIKDFATLYYTRTFENNDWQPWYMPFDVELSDVENELEVACLNNIHQYDDNEDDEIDRTELEAIKMNSGTLLANYPYIVRAKTAGEKEFVFENVTVEPFENNSIDCSSVATKFTFTGSNTAMAYNSSYYGLENNCLISPASTIYAYVGKEVVSESELSNDKVYALRSGRTFLLYSSNEEVAGKLCGGNGGAVGNVSRNINDVNQHFKIENINGDHYLYSVGAGKYVNNVGEYVDTPTDALTIENVGGEYQWKLGIGSNYLNSQSSGHIVREGILVDYWSTTDEGNCYIIEELVPSFLAPNRWYLNIEARNPMFKAPVQIRLFIRGENNEDGDETAIESVEMGDEKGESRNEKGESRNEKGESRNEKVEIYDLAGRKVANPGKGIYIVNGQRVLIK